MMRRRRLSRSTCRSRPAHTAWRWGSPRCPNAPGSRSTHATPTRWRSAAGCWRSGTRMCSARCRGRGRGRAETLQRLVANLTRTPRNGSAATATRCTTRLTGETWNLAAPPCDPLELAGRLVQEDLCIIQHGERRRASPRPCCAFPAAGGCTRNWARRLRRCMDRCRSTPNASRRRSIASWRR